LRWPPPCTRDRILATSLALFNDERLASVSTHRMAAELGISPGNLHYHFKSKRLVVAGLLRRFEELLSACMDVAAAVDALDDLWLSLHLAFETINAYRFVYLDADHLLDECPELEARASADGAQPARREQLCSRLRDAGVIEAGDKEVEMLALQIDFATTCWFSFKRLAPKRSLGAHAH